MNKKLIKFIVTVVFLIFNTFIFSRGIVYILNVNTDIVWANSAPSQGHYVTELRDAIKRLGYTPIWTHNIKNLENDFEKLVCCDLYRFDHFHLYPKEKMIAFLWEPPVVLNFNYDRRLHRYFSKIYTWNNSLVDNKKYLHFYHPVHGRMIESDIPFNQRKLCTMINCNKDSKHPLSLYGERRNVIKFFEQSYCEDFDFYGYGWGSAGFKNYKGKVASKLHCLKNYKFCYAYENTHDIDGYITEKIFDAFKAGCVPVYWGASNITDYIPKECFIDRRDFKDDEELYWFLNTMQEDEYKKYIDSIKKFLDSDQSLLFSPEYSFDIFLSAIEPGYNKSVALTERQRAIIDRVHSYLQMHGK